MKAIVYGIIEIHEWEFTTHFRFMYFILYVQDYLDCWYNGNANI